METKLFDFELPKKLIAQNPTNPRDHSRLMHLDRSNQTWQHYKFYQIVDLLGPNDVLVFNNTEVSPWRLYGQKTTGGKVELLIDSLLNTHQALCLVKPGLKKNARLTIQSTDQKKSFEAQIIDIQPDGLRIIDFHKPLSQIIQQAGHLPLPPYITDYQGHPDRYQTVYAQKEGSMAAPTAGLHFTPKLLESIKNKGVQIEYLTLHVGRETFTPLKGQNIEDHHIHTEYAHLPPPTAHRLNQAKQNKKRIIAVGTTSIRTLEFVASLNKDHHLTPFSGDVTLYITPGYEFKFVNSLITNFHTPRSTLLVLVSALAGHKLIQQAYQEAIKQKYHFFSFGDAMFIT